MPLRKLLAPSLGLALAISSAAAAAATPATPKVEALTLHTFLQTQERFPSVAVFGPSGCFIGYYLPDEYGSIGTKCAPGTKHIKQLGATAPKPATGKPTVLLLVLEEKFHCGPCAIEKSRPQLDNALGSRKSQFAVVKTEVYLKARGS